MKKITFLVLGLILVAFAFGQIAMNTKPAAETKGGNAIFKWSATEYDFGKIEQGVPVSYEFTFTNSGDAPLVISTVQASCGCTVTSYSKEPIEPNGQGFVKATYNAASLGTFAKNVTVTANTDEQVVKLMIKGEVVAKKAE